MNTRIISESIISTTPQTTLSKEISNIENNEKQSILTQEVENCIEDLLISVENNIECGDVIKVSRMNNLYEHYGVALGDGYVIHCNGEIVNGLSSFSSFGSNNFFENVENVENRECAVEIVTLSTFRFYTESHIIVEQKTQFVNKEKIREFIGSFNYNLVTNNCEHFANFLTSDSHKSSQVTSSLITTSNVVIATGAFVVTHYYTSFLLLPISYLCKKYFNSYT